MIIHKKSLKIILISLIFVFLLNFVQPTAYAFLSSATKDRLKKSIGITLNITKKVTEYAYTKGMQMLNYFLEEKKDEKEEPKNVEVKEESVQATTIAFSSLAKDLKTYIANNNFYYQQCTYSDFSRTNPKNISSKKIDCSTYVSWVIYEYGVRNNISAYKDNFKTSKNSGQLLSFFKNNPSYFQNLGKLSNISTSSLKAGDIIVKDGHAEIFASYDSTRSSYKYRCYNCGSDSSVDSVVSGGACNTSPSSYTVFRIIK